MKKTVVILAHNNYENSLSNKTIANELQQKAENIEIRNLIQLYPDYKIDIEAEQKALVEAENIVLQFPFFWYSTPAILKAWIDDVMQYGFAFGSTWDKLVWKNFVISFTTWAPAEVYNDKEWVNKINDFLTPFKWLSDMIQTNYLDPLISYNMSYIPGVHNKDEITQKAISHSDSLIQKLSAL